jgi:hypothetical protein
VELADGVPATGFMTPQGEPLLPETIISNKAHLRSEMTAMLRRFAAAIPQPGLIDAHHLPLSSNGHALVPSSHSIFARSQ